MVGSREGWGILGRDGLVRGRYSNSIERLRRLVKPDINMIHLLFFLSEECGVTMKGNSDAQGQSISAFQKTTTRKRNIAGRWDWVMNIFLFESGWKPAGEGNSGGALRLRGVFYI